MFQVWMTEHEDLTDADTVAVCAQYEVISLFII